MERRTDDVVRDVLADLVYDDRLPLGRVLDLSDDGEVIELVDPNGCTVDTANADNPDRIGWIAGSAVTTWTMERSEPEVGDVDENWHSNLGVFTWGRDAGQGRILGTPRGPNSPTLTIVAASSGWRAALALSETNQGLELESQLIGTANLEELYAVVVGIDGDAATVTPTVARAESASGRRVRLAWVISELPSGSYVLLVRLTEGTALAVHGAL